MQCIYLQPRGGLGNRMRTIAAAQALASKYDVRFIVLWKRDSGLNCRFDRLFKIPNNIYIKEMKSVFSIIWYSTKVFLLGGKVLRNCRYKNKDECESVLCKGKSLYLRSFSQFYQPKSFDMFTPVDELKSKALSLLPINSSLLIGIHIRRTDNVDSVNVSRTDLFIDKMKQILVESPDAHFFCATDSKEEEQIIRNEFGNSIISNDSKELSRNSDDGIRDALIDMYCLSKYKAIYGSFHSSFSEVASLWSDAKTKLFVVE